ncbi:MAG TPA: CBS domain-containing protein [Solirubrobacteraceae bacterium]|nr:CBS domain-containing protein [Solirubrobacteraceae bacterium]
MEVTAPLGSYLTPRFEHATVGDAMRPWVLSCDPATPLVTVAQRMAGEHVHAIVVLADHGERRPHAVITDRDVLRAADRFDELTAGEIATEQVLEARAGEPLSEAARRMAQHDATHAVVVDDRTGRPVGVLSTLDIAGILGWGRA